MKEIATLFTLKSVKTVSFIRDGRFVTLPVVAHCEDAPGAFHILTPTETVSLTAAKIVKHILSPECTVWIKDEFLTEEIMVSW